METEAGKEITQNDINRKLFEEITRVGDEVVKLGSETRAEMKEFNEKMDARMIRFEDNINLKMNWQLSLFGLFLTGVLVMMGVITKIIPIVPITP